MLVVGVAIGLVLGRRPHPPLTPHADDGQDTAVTGSHSQTPGELDASGTAEQDLIPAPSHTTSATDEAVAVTATDPRSEGALNAETLVLLAQLPGLVLVVADNGEVLHASRDAVDMRLVRRGRLAFEALRDCALKTLANGGPNVCEVTLRRPPMRKVSVELRVQGIPLPGDNVLLMMTDLTEEHRLAAVRRDFIANVSHELKTPVGAMSLLSEALVAARDDPDAVQHFATRMQSEAARLAQLINDVIDLSRVQGDDPLSHADVVDVDALVSAATDYVRGAAELKGIEIVVGGNRDLQVFGDAAQLETALRNVMGNAIAYSEPGTRVALGVRTSPHLVEIDVKDQGMGIPDSERDRIFERFYRVDEARSRVTGGTGLGLSIVRNVCRNHGGDCLVWSVENEGSTFTLQLPSYDESYDMDDEATEEETP